MTVGEIIEVSQPSSRAWIEKDGIEKVFPQHSIRVQGGGTTTIYHSEVRQ